MDLFTHPVAQGRIHKLMLLNPALAGKGRGPHNGLEVMTVAAHAGLRAGQAGLNEVFDLLWRNHECKGTDPI